MPTQEKFYLADPSLKYCMTGFNPKSLASMLENVVYFELLRRGYDVAIGKVGNLEVDFIASNAKDKIYFQVTESMNEPSTRERELAPLRLIRDNYRKVVIAGSCDAPVTQEGIQIVKLTDFLLDDILFIN